MVMLVAQAAAAAELIRQGRAVAALQTQEVLETHRAQVRHRVTAAAAEA
jgi:hypothetical protein